MKKHVSLAAIMMFLIVGVSSANKIPESAWQTGILLNVTSDSSSSLRGVYNNGHGVMRERTLTITHYTIETTTYVYQANRDTNEHDKPLDITINAPVKFAVVGTDMYLNDDTGKSHKLTVATKALKAPPSAK